MDTSRPGTKTGTGGNQPTVPKSRVPKLHRSPSLSHGSLTSALIASPCLPQSDGTGTGETAPTPVDQRIDRQPPGRAHPRTVVAPVSCSEKPGPRANDSPTSSKASESFTNRHLGRRTAVFPRCGRIATTYERRTQEGRPTRLEPIRITIPMSSHRPTL